MKLEEIIEDVFEINHRVGFNLWNIADIKHRPRGLSPRLVLPQRRSGAIRISEQEARILYCSTLNTVNYYYSIETPTEEVYQQTGLTPVSASSDLSLYIDSGEDFKKVANVEFKAHNVNMEQIRKDIEKLIKEGITGNWFHTLKNIDSATLPSLFEKFKQSFEKCSHLIKNELSIVFCFCIIEKEWSCIKHFYYDQAKGNIRDYVEDFFRLDYSVKSDKIEIKNKNAWNLIEKGKGLY